MNKILKTSITSIIFIIAIIGSLSMVKYICQGNLNFRLFCLYSIEGKDLLHIIMKTFMFIALMIFIMTSLVMILRVILGKPLNTLFDPLPIKILNRLITNTMEQSFIFIGLYSYLYFLALQNNNYQFLVELLICFTLGRIFYIIGYTIGTISEVHTLRSFGFSIGILTNLLMVEMIFAKNKYLRSFLQI